VRPLWQRSSFLEALIAHNRAEIEQLERSVRLRVGRAVALAWRRPWRWWGAGLEIAGALRDGRAEHFDGEESALATTPAGAYPDVGEPEVLAALRRRNAELVAQLEAIRGSRGFTVGSALAERQSVGQVVDALFDKRGRAHRAQPRFEPPTTDFVPAVAVGVCGPRWFRELIAHGWPVVELHEAELVLVWDLGDPDSAAGLQAARERDQRIVVWSEDPELGPAIAPQLHSPIGWWEGLEGQRPSFEAEAPLEWQRAFDAGRGLIDTAVELETIFGELELAETSLTGEWGGRARRVIAMRAVHERHTVGHRIVEICRRVGLPVSELTPLVAVVVCSNRPEHLPKVVANLARLDYPRLEIGYIAHGSGFDLGPLEEMCQERGYSLQTGTAPDHYNMGQVRQLSHELSTGDWLAKLDDDDHYGPGYVRDGIWQARMSGAGMVTKRSPCVEFEGHAALYCGPPSRYFRYLFSSGAGGMLIRRDAALDVGVRPVPHSEDMGLVLDFARAGIPVLAGDPFNYVYRRGAAGSHNWERSREQVIAAMALRQVDERFAPSDFFF
jgi:hypothetical protein